MILLHFFTTCALGLDFRLPFSRFLRTFFLSLLLPVCLGGWGDVCGGFYNQQERSGSCYITQCPLLFPPLARRKPNWVLFWTQIQTNRPVPNARRTKVISFAHFSTTLGLWKIVCSICTNHAPTASEKTVLYTLIIRMKQYFFSSHRIPLCSGIRLYKILYKNLHKTQLSTLPCVGRLARGRGG